MDLEVQRIGPNTVYHRMDSDAGVSLVQVYRALALAHYQLAGPLRYNFVYHYFGQTGSHIREVQEFKATKTPQFQCRMVSLLLAGCILPWVYSNFIVNDGCREVEVYMSRNATQLENRTNIQGAYDMIDVHCSTQRFLQSMWSMLLGPVVLALVLVWETILHKRIMLRIYSVLDLITPEIWQLKYHEKPFIYAWVSQAFAILLIEMAFIGLCLRSPIALVVGYAVGKMLLFAASIVLAPEPGCISILDSMLRSLGGKLGLKDFFLRLRDHRGAVFALSQGELQVLVQALKEGGQLEKLNKDAEKGKLSYLYEEKPRHVYFSSLYLKKIYVIEHEGFFQSGVLSREGSAMTAASVAAQPPEV